MARDFFKKGVPFMIVVVGSPFLIQRFNGIRYQYKKSGMLTAEDQLKVEEIAEARKAGVAIDKKTEEVLQKARQISRTSWENKRGPRPWEESQSAQNISHSTG